MTDLERSPRTVSDLLALADATLAEMSGGELVGLRRDVKRLRGARLSEIAALQKVMDRINNELRARDVAEEIEVSDHAVLRYLERVQSVDVQGIRDMIAEKVAAATPTSDRVVLAEGFTVCLAEMKRVTTVFGGDETGNDA